MKAFSEFIQVACIIVGLSMFAGFGFWLGCSIAQMVISRL